MTFPIALSAGAAALAGVGMNARELLRKSPGPNSARAQQDTLLGALDRYVNRTAPDNPIKSIDIGYSKPEEISMKRLLGMEDSDKLASYQRPKPSTNNTPGYYINPNADAGLLAHEMGHIAFGQTPMGKTVQALRDTSPRLTQALTVASTLAPTAVAALTSGEDNDLAIGLGITGILSAPELIDEFEGTRRGLAIMKEAGTPATMGQRARMAGGLLSYAARPVALAAAGAVGGNAIRSMFSQQTSGTAEMF